MGRAFLGETVAKKNNHRVALLPQSPGDALLALADGCRISDRPVVSCRQCRPQPFFHLFGNGASRHFHRLSVRPVEEEVVAHRGKRQAVGFRVSVQAEEVGVPGLEPKATWVVLHVVNHPAQLTGRMKDALMVMGRVLLPDAAPARKNAGKMHQSLLFLSVHFSGVLASRVSLPVHFSGVLAATKILFLVNLRACALEATDHCSDALRQRLEHLNHQMDMVGHHHLCQHLQRIPFLFVELCQPAQHPAHLSAKWIQLYKSLFRALAFQNSEQRIACLHRQGEVIDGTTSVVPSVFTVVPRGIDRTPFPLTLVHCLSAHVVSK